MGCNDSDKDIYPWDPLFRSYHGVFFIFAVVIGIAVAFSFFFRVETQDSETPSSQTELTTHTICPHPFDYEQKLEKHLEEQQAKLESMSNGLTLWATVMTVIFVVFTILGLLKIDEKIKAAKEKADEIDSKNRGIFATVALIMLSKELSENFSPFLASTFKFIADREEDKDGTSKSDALIFFLQTARANATTGEQASEGDFLTSLTICDTIIENKSFESQNKLLKSLIFFQRGYTKLNYIRKFEKCLLSSRGSSFVKEKLLEALSDFDAGRRFAWDDRAGAFFCSMAIDTLLLILLHQKLWDRELIQAALFWVEISENFQIRGAGTYLRDGLRDIVLSRTDSGDNHIPNACREFMTALNAIEQEKAKLPSVTEYFEWRRALVNRWITWIKNQYATKC